MKITQIRNATVLLEFESEGRRVGVLVDPMLADAGQLPALRFKGRARRNPLVELPLEWDDLSRRTTHGLITHCQRGHFDHLDLRGIRYLRDKGLAVFCMPRDTAYLQRRGLRTHELNARQRQPFFGGWITPVPCVHGRGWVGRIMEHGSGYLIELPNEPSLYLAGDTILSQTVRNLLVERKPDVAVLPAGGARFDLGGAILMDAEDVVTACSLTPGFIVANHLEALDHCPTTRTSLARTAEEAGVTAQLLIPRDGQTLNFPN